MGAFTDWVGSKYLDQQMPMMEDPWEQPSSRLRDEMVPMPYYGEPEGGSWDLMPLPNAQPSQDPWKDLMPMPLPKASSSGSWREFL